MKLSRTLILVSIVLIIVFVIGVLLFQRANSGTTVTFAPPYPEFNTNGDPILAVFEGRIPCKASNCEKLKVGLVLYQNKETLTPTTYWLGLIGASGNDRVVTQGTWTIQKGIKDYPEAVVYKLDSNTEADFQNYWRLNEDIILPLDQNLNPKVGDAAWGYMLSRYSAPYGPRTYEL
ncbi:MAG: hypothetical protein ACMG57_05940 [Candidatus Dojkabacteria bacterium]